VGTRTKLLLSSTVVILLAIAGLAVSTRSPVPDVPIKRLLINAPPELPGARNVIWTSVLESVDREGVGVVSEWSAATLGALVTHEVGHFSNWLAAEWQLRMHSPAGRYARLFDLTLFVKSNRRSFLPIRIGYSVAISGSLSRMSWKTVRYGLCGQDTVDT
jgi:hypothetical protein